MKKKVLISSKQGFLCEADVADTFFARFLGLMGRSPIGRALYIVPCGDIHTFFMKESIDVVFISREGRVLNVIPSMGKNRMSGNVQGAHGVLELPAGALGSWGTEDLGILTITEAQNG